MIDTGSVERALGSLERLAPDEGAVLAGFRQRVALRRRRRQVAGVVGVAGTATAVAVGVVFALPDRGTDRGGTPTVSAASPPASPSPPSSKAETVLPAPELPFTVAWLPPGYTLARWDVSDAGTYAYYEAEPDARTGTTPTIMVGASTARPEDPGGAVAEPTTIGGHPGVLQRMTIGTQFMWQFPGGPWVVVGTRDEMSEDQLRRVAESVARRPTSLAVAVGLTRLPDGYRLARSSDQGAESVMLTLCREGVDPMGPVGDQCLDVRVMDGTAPTELPNRDGTKMDTAPLDREKVVDGVLTRATADGKTVVAQVGEEHWVEVSTIAGDTSLLRSVAAATVVTP
ncbi:hypothetical protein [Actinophytocola sp. NPDC049390]|uniref:hypothetical protein n=1 Tax=Actinophytocola sp. NPDC049390 TaxID=3363894 RepID=UPI0037949474